MIGRRSSTLFVRPIPSDTLSIISSHHLSSERSGSRSPESTLPTLTSSESSDSSSTESSSPPLPRRSNRQLQRSSSFAPSDLDTFLTARRSLPRSVRFPELPSLPPSSMSLAANPFAALSDPADHWAGENNDQPPPSVASSRLSVNSIARRDRARSEFQAQQKARMEAFMAAEAELEREVEEKMKLADIKSEVGVKVEGAPVGSAIEAERGVAERRLADLEHEAASLRRVLGSHPSPHPLPNPSSPISPPLHPSVPSLARFGVKVKVEKPKPWTGSFEEQAREGWIRSASLYFVGNELELDAVLDEHLTPAPFYVLRSLFSADATNGLLSPQSWFDARNRRGSLRAHDFGAKVDTLADACSDRIIDDLDRRTTFVNGLHASVRDFIKTQLASRAALGKTSTTFEEVVKIAALTDGLSGFSSLKKTTPPVVSPSKRPSTNETSSLQTPFSSRGAGTPTNWVDQAVDWQAKNPVAEKARWFDSHASPPTKSIRCFNCGEQAGHYSRACPKPRKNPKVVVLAALHKLSRSASSTLPSNPPPPSPRLVSLKSPLARQVDREKRTRSKALPTLLLEIFQGS
ncbi:hypothetical protein JCM11641_000603 [Rhodosporidiobolus odoratus]